MCSCVISIAKKVFCDLKSKYIKKDRGFLPEIYSGFFYNYAYGGESDGLLNFLLFISRNFITKGNENMKTKKLLSLILAVIMIMSVVPIYASAEDQIALTVDNITVYPTAEGFIYFGQKISDGVTLSGGEVQYDGTVVAGHFEFAEPEFQPTTWASAYRPKMIFVPDDTDTYESFEVPASKNTSFAVKKTTPVFVDENDPPVATEVEPGAKLSTSTLSGGQVKNPYNPDEPKALAGYWRWTTTSTVVSESGYYQARMVIANYEVLYMDVYVKVASDIPETTITEYPTIPELTYNPDVTWADIELTGGKAVIKETGKEVEGTFAIKDTRLTVPPNPNFKEIEVVFTPANAEEALPYEFTIPVTVNPLPISFGENNEGTAIDDPFEYEVGPDTLVSSVLSYLKSGILNYPTPSVVSIENANDYVENGKTYEISVVNYTNTNYTGTYAYVKVVFTTVEFAVSSVSYLAGTEKIHVKFNSSSCPGTFDVYVDGTLIGDDVPRAGDHIDVPYKLETSGTHTVKVVYNPTDGDYYFMADYETEIKANAQRYITLKDMNDFQKISVNGKNTLATDAYIVYGDEISIKYDFEDLFISWVITDTAGNTVTLDGVDLTSSEISFTMPDHDLVLSVVTTLEEETPGDKDIAIDSVWAFFQKIIDWFTNMIKQLLNLMGLGA